MLGSLLDPRLAVALVTMSVVVSNIWQSVRSGILFSAMQKKSVKPSRPCTSQNWTKSRGRHSVERAQLFP